MDFDYSVLHDISTKLDSLEQLDNIVKLIIALSYVNFAMLLASIINLFRKKR